PHVCDEVAQEAVELDRQRAPLRVAPRVRAGQNRGVAHDAGTRLPMASQVNGTATLMAFQLLLSSSAREKLAVKPPVAGLVQVAQTREPFVVIVPSFGVIPM